MLQEITREEADQAYSSAREGVPVDTGVEMLNDMIRSDLFPANRVVKKEAEWHRECLYMHASGYKPIEISRTLDKSPAAVSELVRQPWYRAALVDLLNKRGGDGVLQFLREELPATVDRIIEIRDNGAAKGSAVSLAASIAILDRIYGKPVQRTENLNVNTTQQLSMEQLKERYARIQAERKAILGRDLSTEELLQAAPTKPVDLEVNRPEVDQALVDTVGGQEQLQGVDT